MEISCTRCHQTVLTDSCYCPACGLPQLVYTAEGTSLPNTLENGADVPRDASTIDWKTALRFALMFAIPAGILCSGVSPLGVLGLFWMGAAAAWVVALYMRTVKPAWITLGAGARIGLVTGLLGGWLAFGITGGAFFVERYVLHHSGQITADWNAGVGLQQRTMQQFLAGAQTSDPAQLQEVQAQVQSFYSFMLTPEGHAGWQAAFFACNAGFFLLFAVAGGVFGAKLLGRTRRPEV